MRVLEIGEAIMRVQEEMELVRCSCRDRTTGSKEMGTVIKRDMQRSIARYERRHCRDA